MPEAHSEVIHVCEYSEEYPNIFISRRPLHKPLPSFMHVLVTDR